MLFYLCSANILPFDLKSSKHMVLLSERKEALRSTGPEEASGPSHPIFSHIP